MPLTLDQAVDRVAARFDALLAERRQRMVRQMLAEDVDGKDRVLIVDERGDQRITTIGCALQRQEAIDRAWLADTLPSIRASLAREYRSM